MKIWTQGCREKYCQLPRIEAGFVQLGHELTSDILEADLVYANNAWYDDVLKYIFKIKGTIVFNVLDLAPHIPDFPVERLAESLACADVVTTISQTVREDLINRTGFDSTVVYQPIQNITRTNHKKYPQFKYLFCGRVRDPNKRAKLGIDALQILGETGSKVISIGTEFAGFGAYTGLIEDEKAVNDIFNSVDYVMFPSKEEGIGLPAIEAMAAGAIPVLCSDLSTLKEFFPFEEYSHIRPDGRDLAYLIDGLEQNPAAKEDFRNRLHQHYKDNLEEKFSGLGVAKRILAAANLS